VPPQPPRLVPDLLRERARRYPDEVAVTIDGGGDLTFRAWEQRSNALARGLVAAGVGPRAVVGLCLGDEHWIDYAVSYSGVQKAGAAPLVLSDRLTATERSDALRRAGAGLLLTAGAPDEVGAGRPGVPIQVPTAPDALAEIVQTSGTTGVPKLVAATHAGVLFPFSAGGGAGPERPRSTYLHSLHISTSAAQGLLLLPLHPRAGIRAAVVPRFEPERFCAAIERFGATQTVMAPALAGAIVESGAARRHDVSRLRTLCLSGAHAPGPLRQRLVEAFPDATLVLVYGCTEAGAASVVMRHDPARPDAAGRPVNRTQIRIAGPDGRPLPAGSVGEVWLCSPGSPGRVYLGDAEATAEVFSEGWTRTGDLGHLDSDGYLFVDDRQKDVVNCGGLMVSSLEVEEALSRHPAVVEAAVFAVPHPRLGEQVAAAVVCRRPVDRTELARFARRRLAAHKVPTLVVPVESLPRTPSGKVRKAELRSWAVHPGAGAAPVTEAERRMAALWQELLHPDAPVSADDDFFSVGGSSLSAAGLVARINDVFGVELGVAALYETPILRELATRCEARN
jgi:acyl-CoA synthetase (AMP-forming)/AMP-acid ligase II